MAAVTSLANVADARARRLKAIEAVAVHGMTQKEAAAYAGLKASSVGAMLKDERVQAYIRDLQEAQAKTMNVKREQVIRGILDAIEHARMANEPASEMRGWETIAKMQGYFAPDRVIHDLPEDTKRLMETMRDMDENQLAQLAGQDNLIDLRPGEGYDKVCDDE